MLSYYTPLVVCLYFEIHAKACGPVDYVYLLPIIWQRLSTLLPPAKKGVVSWQRLLLSSQITMVESWLILGKRIKWLILPLHESETDRHLIGLSG